VILSRLCIDTIDCEKVIDKDLIIISCVRSNKVVGFGQQGNIGELQDGRILNSVMLNARRGVIVVGSIATLVRGDAFRDFILWGKSNSIIVKYC